MSEPIQQLYPQGDKRHPLKGLYLSHRVQRLGAPGRPFVYSNFISSLDGRIAVAAPGRRTHQVPPPTANARDWRLFQELGAQADLLIVSARYFRQFVAGEAQDVLPVGHGQAFADLHDWRLDHGLEPQPDLAVVSASLDIPIAAIQAHPQRRIHLLTGANADPDRLAPLQAAGVEVHAAGEGHTAEGGRMLEVLAECGYRSIYAIAGPYILNTLIQANALHRLYLTFANRILGGEEFDTFIYGASLDPAVSLELKSLYYDPLAPEGAGQLLTCYDVLPRPSA